MSALIDLPLASVMSAWARRSHAVHVDLAEVAQPRDEFGHVHTRSAVDLRRVLPAEHVDAHGDDVSGPDDARTTASWTTSVPP